MIPDAAHMTAMPFVDDEAGLWMVVPFAEQAYQLDARYTMNPSDVFSVEEEIQQWVRGGRY